MYVRRVGRFNMLVLNPNGDSGPKLDLNVRIE